MTNLIKQAPVLVAIFFSFSVLYSQSLFRLPHGATEDDVITGKMIVKIREEYRHLIEDQSSPNPILHSVLSAIGKKELKQLFPNSDKPLTNFNSLGQKLVDITRIYEINYYGEKSFSQVADLLLSTEMFEYVEPRFRYKVFYNPSDTMDGTIDSYHTDIIDAHEAWDLQRGDSNVVMGIIDTGTSFDHSDLKNQHKLNYGDTIDGIDNDNDGFIDNFRGWDFTGDSLGSQGDNDPTGTNTHGMKVAAPAVAQGDNLTCIAGICMNCKFNAFKVLSSSGYITKGYDAIVYGADHDVRILNNSWGGTFKSHFGEDVINYATINKNSAIICAGGNWHYDISIYPAGYDNAYGVAGSDDIDSVWYNNQNHATSYSHLLSFAAPAFRIGTIDKNEKCFVNTSWTSGTSLAAPIVTGAAGLVQSHFPSWSARQVMEQLRVTTDDIYPNIDAKFHEKIGTGRINVHRALIETRPAVRIAHLEMSNGGDAILYPGDTVHIRAKFVNFLAPVSNLMISLSSPSPDIQILNGSFNAGTLGTLDTIGTQEQEFLIVIDPGADPNSLPFLRFGFNGTSYDDWEYRLFSIEPGMIDLVENDVETSIDAFGHFGNFNGDGQGFLFNSEIGSLSGGGLLVGTSGTRLANCIGNEFGGTDFDFLCIDSTEIMLPAPLGGLQVRTSFTDDMIIADPLDIDIDLNAYQFKGGIHASYVILRYTFKNAGQDSLLGLFAGLYGDWDSGTSSQNDSYYDSLGRFVYVIEPNETYTYLSAMGALTSSNIYAYAGELDSVPLSDSMKFHMLTSDPQSANQGTYDAFQVISQGPFNIAPGESIDVGYFLGAADSIEGLRTVSDAALKKYNCVIQGQITHADLGHDITVCTGDTTIMLSPGTGYASYSWSSGESSSIIPVSGFGTQLYSVTVTDGLGCEDESQINISINPPRSIGFTTSPVSAAIGDTVWFTDTTTSGTMGRTWDFGDGTMKYNQNPVWHIFSSTTDNQAVTLFSDRDCNCRDMAVQTIIICDTVPALAQFNSTGTESTVDFSSAPSYGINFNWDFGDGTFSDQPNPTHTFPDAGFYNVCLTAATHCGSNSICNFVEACIMNTDFSYSLTQQTISLNPDYAGTNTFLWNFGDGIISSLPNPSHIYAENGTYEVCLTVNTSCGDSDTSCQSVDVNYVNLASEQTFNGINVSPNPFSENLTISINNNSFGSIHLEIRNSLGQIINNSSSQKSTANWVSKIDLKEFPKGVYFIKIKSNSWEHKEKIIKF